MKTIPDIFLRRIKTLAVAAPVVPLMDLALNDTADTHIRLVRDTRPLVYGGHTYAASGFEAQVLGASKREGIPTFTVAVHDVDNVIRPHLPGTNYLAGATVTFGVASTDLLSLDYQDLVHEYDVIKAKPQAEWVHLVVGGPNLLRQRYPWGRFLADLCEYDFGDDPRCPYVPKTIAGVTLAGAQPVAVTTATAHQAETGDRFTLASVGGIAPALAGTYTVTVVDSTTIKLDGTHSNSYSGSYTSGGTAGFATCERSLAACRKREATAAFWGFVGLRSRVYRLAF